MSSISAIFDTKHIAAAFKAGEDAFKTAVAVGGLVGDVGKIIAGIDSGNAALVLDGVMGLSKDVKRLLQSELLQELLSLAGAEPGAPPSRDSEVERVRSKTCSGSAVKHSGEAERSTSSSASSGTESVSSRKKASSEDSKDAKETNGRDAAKAFIASHKDPEDFMNAIRNGDIPDDIINSTAGMMMIQQRMQEINRMNELMTQMMRAMHEMEMAIVRNVRA